MDVLTTIVNILTNNWNSSNTDGITPIIGKIFDYKRIDLASNDYVLCYEVDETHEPFGLGGEKWATVNDVSIDIRTTYKGSMNLSEARAHAIKMADEVKRILKSKIKNPDSNFQLLLLARKLDLSDKSVGMWRMVIDCRLRNWGVS